MPRPSYYHYHSYVLSWSSLLQTGTDEGRTDGSTTVSNVMIVDRNQGIGASPCSPGDVDVSDAVYRILAKTTTADANAGLGIEVQGVSWRWD